MWIESIIGLGGILLANYGVKFGRAFSPLKAAFNLMKEVREAKEDGIVTDKEKAEIYDSVEELYVEAYAYLKGYFPNKSK